MVQLPKTLWTFKTTTQGCKKFCFCFLFTKRSKDLLCREDLFDIKTKELQHSLARAKCISELKNELI